MVTDIYYIEKLLSKLYELTVLLSRFVGFQDGICDGQHLNDESTVLIVSCPDLQDFRMLEVCI